MSKGITLIELLLVVAIIALLGATTTPFLSRFVLQTQFDASLDKVVSSIRKAQQYSMSEKISTGWGVCLIGNTVRMFLGSCNSPTIAEDFVIPQTVSIQGLSTTTFNTRGEPSNALSITISTAIDSKTISVNSAGGMTNN